MEALDSPNRASKLSNVGKFCGKWVYLFMLEHEYRRIGISLIAARS